MKKLFLTTLLLISTSSFAANASFIGVSMQGCDQIIDKKIYKICFDYGFKGARYAWATLDGSKVFVKNIEPRPSFYAEKDLPKQYRVRYKDYMHNEFHDDAGHLISDASFDYSKKTLNLVYSMANIIPQYRSINRGNWKYLEMYSRKKAAKFGSLDVLNGVVYGKEIHWNSGMTRPVAFWKMLSNKDHGFRECYWFDNDKNAIKEKYWDHKIPCKSLRMKHIKAVSRQ